MSDLVVFNSIHELDRLRKEMMAKPGSVVVYHKDLSKAVVVELLLSEKYTYRVQIFANQFEHYSDPEKYPLYTRNHWEEIYGRGIINDYYECQRTNKRKYKQPTSKEMASIVNLLRHRGNLKAHLLAAKEFPDLD